MVKEINLFSSCARLGRACSIKKAIVILILTGFILPNFSLAQSVNDLQPENMTQVKELGQKTLDTAKKDLPGLIKSIWKEQVLPTWQKMWNWFKVNVLEPYIKPFFQKEIDKRKPGLNEEVQKETQVMAESTKTEVPKAVKSISSFWEKLKDLFSTK